MNDAITNNHSLTWEYFLNSQPVLWQARQGLSESAFIRFLNGLQGDLRGEAFAQISWTEGASYTISGSVDYVLMMFRLDGPNFRSSIVDRNLSQARKWVGREKEVMEAGRLLDAALLNFSQSAEAA